ncbi:hypothetical protein AGMMS49525_11370 [Bacteroidia bacterium]|nr:hypothetical protein AGMMS49525_11370 [Bacteroidia bacterium]
MTKKNLGRFMDLTTDFGFKTVFSEKNEELLLSFLNGIFEGRKVIVKINHLRLKQLGNSPEDRDAIFDLYCTDEDDNHYIVEMQVAQQKNFMDRCLYYAAIQGKIFDELFAITELNKLNTKDMETYVLSEKRRYDYQLTVDYAEEKGLKKGLEQGLIEGEKKGRIAGRMEGRHEGRQEGILFIAKQMKGKGVSLEFIVSTTGLTSEQLKGI